MACRESSNGEWGFFMLNFFRKREAKKNFGNMLENPDEESLKQYLIALDITLKKLPALGEVECESAKREFRDIVEKSHAKFGTEQFDLYWASWNLGWASHDAKQRGDDKAWLLHELVRSYLKSESLLIFGDTAINYLDQWANGEIDEETLEIAERFQTKDDQHEWVATFENFSIELPKMTYEKAMDHVEGIEMTSGGAFVSLVRRDEVC